MKIENEIDRVCDYVGYKKKSELIVHITHLSDRISDELDDCLFLHIPQVRSKYYRATNLFGIDVGKKFPKCAEDIANAGTCYALGQNTACVFHLMRAMEHCVQRFGKKLRISLKPAESSWYEIMEQVNAQVKGMPGGKRASRAQNTKRQKFGLAAGRLDHVRIVWRNDVMHPKATYDDAEALEILTGVEAFFRSVAELL